MGKYYAVLYGKKGVKEFDTRQEAERFAINKVQSNKGRVPVTIDRVLTTKSGGFNQRTVKQVKYKKNNQNYMNDFGFKIPKFRF